MSEKQQHILAAMNPTWVPGTAAGFFKPNELGWKAIWRDTLWFWGPRSHLETNAAFRQVIPYVLVTYDNKVLSYRRTKQAGEARLHGKRAIGFGGHVDLLDCEVTGNRFDAYDTILQAAQRELNEELGLIGRHQYGLNSIEKGIIVAHETPVDQVHVGLVCVANVVNPTYPTAQDPELTDLQWLDVNAMPEDDTWETWSKMLIPHLPQIIGG